MRNYVFKKEPGTKFKVYDTSSNDSQIDPLKKPSKPKTKG